jgi:hypothetical protein
LTDRRCGFRTQLLQHGTAKLVGGGWLSQPELDDENNDEWLDDHIKATEVQLQSRYGDMERQAMALFKAYGGNLPTWDTLTGAEVINWLSHLLMVTILI